MEIKITKRAVDQLAPNCSESAILWDSDLRGFGIRCRPSGAKFYVLKVRIGDLARADVARLQHELRDRPYQANRNLAVLSKMLNLAEEWGLRADGSNPVRHVKKHREDKRKRYLTDAELGRLGSVLVNAQD